MAPSFEQLFITKVAAAAARCAADTGLWTSVVIAQWADETGWGTSRAWLYGNNPAGISPRGEIASYASEAAGFAAYVATMLNGDYKAVIAAKSEGAIAQAYALGASPWAGGHYIAAGSETPGSALVSIIESMNLTAYDGAETALNPPPAPAPSPSPPEEEMPSAPFVAGATGTDEPVFIVWSDGTKTWIADPSDLAGLYARFGQSSFIPLSPGTLSQIPSKSTVEPAGTVQPATTPAV